MGSNYKENNSLILNFTSPCDSYILTFEDDGKVGYAYLRKGDDIVGDVWLYNRCQTPTEPEWRDKSKIPFANSTAYVSLGAQLKQALTSRDILVDWDDKTGSIAYIYIFEDLYGVVDPGDKPGYARFASEDGPLAQVMEIG